MEEVLTVRVPAGTRRKLEERARTEQITVSQYVRRALDTDHLLGAFEAARADLVAIGRTKGIYTDEDVYAKSVPGRAAADSEGRGGGGVASAGASEPRQPAVAAAEAAARRGRRKRPILPRGPVELGGAYDICGLSAGELARRAGVSASYISRLLKGERRPSADVLERMAQVLNVPMEALQSEMHAIRQRAKREARAAVRHGGVSPARADGSAFASTG